MKLPERPQFTKDMSVKEIILVNATYTQDSFCAVGAALEAMSDENKAQDQEIAKNTKARHQVWAVLGFIVFAAGLVTTYIMSV